MIAVNINAGLANQMFHYAFGRGLIAKGLDVYFDQSNFKPRKEWSFEFVKLQDAFPNIEIKVMPKGRFRFAFLSPEEEDWSNNSRFHLFIPKILRKLGIERYIYEKRYAYTEGIEKLATWNCMYRGFWQSEKYFKHCENDIRKQFTFIPFDEEQNIATAKKMSSENSVSIHVRKGKDYLRSSEMANEICCSAYYKSAISYIKEHVESPVFYLFTDNVEWAKEHLNGFEYTLVDWNPISGKRNFRDMQLMSCAKHNIIANSTYSWWGAWLNPNPHKIVIGPETFFPRKYKFFEEQDIMCSDWICIK